MTLYWLTIAALLVAVTCSWFGGLVATVAGYRFWQRFHARVVTLGIIATLLFAMIGAPIAYKL